MDSERIGKEESCLGMKVLGYEIETFMNDSITSRFPFYLMIHQMVIILWILQEREMEKEIESFMKVSIFGISVPSL